MLHLTVAGSLEPLADELADRLEVPLADPFTPEVVVVPGAGVRDWVTRRVAGRLGVAANLDFAFPAALVARVLGDDDGYRAWAVGPLTWAIHEVLVERGEELGLPADAVRARAIADLFDRYALYRPGMVLRWSAGDDVGATGLALDEHQRWQPALWRDVQHRLGGGPTDAQRLAASAGPAGGRGRRPPRRGARAGVPLRPGQPAVAPPRPGVRPGAPCEVHVLAPVASPADWAWVADRLTGPLALPVLRSDDAAVAGSAHPLVTGWGRTSRRPTCCFGAAQQVDRPDIVAPDPPPPLPADASVLARLQHGIRADAWTDAGVVRELPVLDAADPSIRWHRTYGPARQVEVLRDALLHLLEERDDDGSPRFEPRDVAVLCADPGGFAPLVEATFAGDPDHGVPRLPVQVADRSLRRDNALLDAAAGLLDLLDGRLRASSVVAFASRAPVRHRFGLDADALGRISEWVEATNVRWGLDAEGQATFGLPAALDGVHTWRAGLDQLLLGATMAAGGHRLGPGDVVPFADVEGDDVTVAGALAELLHHLGAAVTALRTPCSVADWVGALGEALPTLCSVPDADAWQWLAVERTLAAVADEATVDGAPRTQPVEPAELAALLRARLAGSPGRPRFGTGAITVSSLTAQRGVPHRVVCLLGLDDDVTAGGLAAAEDLVAAEPCLGDRDPRSEQRAQLLDAVLAAGERLVICSTGHDLRTNAEVPPAVALAELFDVIDATVRVPDGADEGITRARDLLTVDHPRQAWAEAAFLPGGLGVDGPWSFDAGARSAAEARRGQGAVELFLPEPLPPPEPVAGLDHGGAPVVPLADLIAACANPAKVLLQGRLGVRLPDEDEVAEDQIPVKLAGLDKWKITRALLDAHLEAGRADDGSQVVDPATWERVERRRGAVPPLAFGDTAVVEARTRVRQLLAQLSIELGDVPHDPQTVAVEVRVVDADGTEVVIEGHVPGVCDDLVVTITPSSLKDKDLLTAWVRLAVLSGVDPSRRWRSITVGGARDGKKGKLGVQRVELQEAGRADEVVAAVLRLHRTAGRDAVPFFPATSRALFCDGVPAARGRWFDRYGEAEDAWIGRLFPTDFDALLVLPVRPDEQIGGAEATSRLRYWAEQLWGTMARTATVLESEPALPAVDEEGAP
ncbi:MAG: exodeoxyribonuclease V subunit gamma [Acidimicrobiales bacterium]